MYNLEATPAESTAYRLAKHDKARYPNIVTANENGTPYYTNSSHLPVGYTDDVFSALDIQDKFQPLYTSGTVFHTFLGEKLPEWKSAAALVRKIAENYELPYYTLSPTYSVCANHGYLTGEQSVCPKCGKQNRGLQPYYRLLSPGSRTGTTEKVRNFWIERLTVSVWKRLPKSIAKKRKNLSRVRYCELYTTSGLPKLQTDKAYFRGRRH